jgi:hypothetical protein
MPPAISVPLGKKLSSEKDALSDSKDEGSAFMHVDARAPLFGEKTCTPADTETNTVPVSETTA